MGAITDVSTFSDPLTIWDDGDNVASADDLVHLQKIANRTRWLANSVPGLGAAARVIVPLFAGNSADTLIHRIDSIGPNLAPCWLQADTDPSAGVVYFGIPFPMSAPDVALADIRYIQVDYYVDTGRALWPSTRPLLKLWRQINDGSAVPELLGTLTNTSTNLVTYEVGATTIGLAFAADAVPVEGGYNYFFAWTGEICATGGTLLGLLNISLTLAVT